MRTVLICICFVWFSNQGRAQWISGGMFSVFNHFQASAFHTPDTGLFVYGSDNPISGEGGVIATYSGATGGGFYLWYEQPLLLEDIDVVVSNSIPYYVAAGTQSGGYSVVVRPTNHLLNPFQFDSVRTGSNQFYRTIRMRSDLVVFTGGGDAFGNGIIDMSADTARSFNQVASFPGQVISRIRFATDSLGFATSGGYQRTNNNGVHLPDSGAIYRSTDGGLNWTQVHTNSNTGFSDITFLNATNGVSTQNDGGISYTTDGGSNWQSATINYSDTVLLTAITFRPDGFAFALGYKPDGSEGVVLISIDQGATWNPNFSTASLNHARRLYGITFYDLAHGYISSHVRPLKNDGIITDAQQQTVSNTNVFSFDRNTGSLFLPEGSKSLEVFNTGGRLLRNVRTAGTDHIRLHLEPGIYLIRSLQVDGLVHSEALFLF